MEDRYDMFVPCLSALELNPDTREGVQCSLTTSIIEKTDGYTMSVCDTTIYTPEECAFAKGILPENYLVSDVTRIAEIAYIPTGQTLGTFLTSLPHGTHLLNEYRRRIKNTCHHARMTNLEYAEAQTDQELSKWGVEAPGDRLALVARALTPLSVEQAREYLEISTAHSALPSEDQVCLTADGQFGYCLPQGFPTSCDLHDPPQRFRPGERYSRRTRRHTTLAESGYQPEYTDRDIYPGSGCEGCGADYTQGPVLTDISGTQWWHLKRNDQDKIIRCPGTMTDLSTSLPAAPKPQLPRVRSGFSGMSDQRNQMNQRRMISVQG